MLGESATWQIARLRLLELDRDKLRHAHFFHRHAIRRARRFHRALIVRDDDELRVGRHRNNFVGETPDVRFVERRIDLVEQTERSRPIMKYSQDQCQGGHRFFTAREEEHILQTLARWLRDYVYTGFKFVVRVNQAHLATAAAEEFLEQFAEVLIDLLKGVAEAFARTPLDFAQRFLSSRNSTCDVVALGSQKREALVCFGKLFQRHHVYGAKIFQTVA